MASDRPTDPPEPPEDDGTERTIGRGALVNMLGSIGKLLVPLGFVVITRLFGPDAVGLFLLSSILLDVATNLTVSGINDGVVLLATRREVAEDEDGAHDILANAFGISLAVAFALIGLAYFGGPEGVHQWSTEGPRLVPLLQLMALALPFRVISIVVVAATKVKLTMKWDALLNGFGRPGVFLAAAVVAYYVEGSPTGLAWAYVVSWVAVGVVALAVFPRYYRYSTLFARFRRFRFSAPLVAFAIPQNLNMAVGRFATDIDAVMLAYFNVAPAQIAFYYMGGQIVRNLRQIKLVFSGAYAPIISRLQAQGDDAAMNRAFSMVSRWATTIALPAALVVAIFRDELIWLFHDTFIDDTTFMLPLLVVPLLSCSVGLASNVIVMTGHSRWNLFNAILQAGINVTLNYLWIPEHGILGAAMATAVSGVFVSTLTLIEARVLVGVTLSPRRIYKPFLAGLVATGIAGAWLHFAPDPSLPLEIAIGLSAIAGYVGVLLGLGVPRTHGPSSRGASAERYSPSMNSRTRRARSSQVQRCICSSAAAPRRSRIGSSSSSVRSRATAWSVSSGVTRQAFSRSVSTSRMSGPSPEKIGRPVAM